MNTFLGLFLFSISVHFTFLSGILAQKPQRDPDVLFHFVFTVPDLVVPGDDLEVGGGGLDALHRPLHISLRGVDLKKGEEVYCVLGTIQFF